MRLVVAAMAASILLHAGVFVGMQRMGTQRQKRSREAVPMVVRKSERRRDAPAPPPPEPRRAARVRPKPIARPATPRLEPPPPPQGFSVDKSSTAASSSVAVAAKQGGGNMFADPGDGLPAGDKISAAPPPRVVSSGPLEPAQWLTPESERSPPYPGMALRREIEGQVVLRVCIDIAGHVDSVAVVRGLGFGCDEAAADWAQKRWRFRPARRGESAVPTCILQPVRFQLHR
jgi:periplasmic protein TonB